MYQIETPYGSSKEDWFTLEVSGQMRRFSMNLRDLPERKFNQDKLKHFKEGSAF